MCLHALTAMHCVAVQVENTLMLQQIATFDENGQPVSKGTKVLRGYYADNGPQTTLDPAGKALRP